MGVTVSKADVGKHGWASRGGMLAKQGAGRGQIVASFTVGQGQPLQGVEQAQASYEDDDGHPIF